MPSNVVFVWQIPRYTEFPRTNTPAMRKMQKKIRIGKKKYQFYQPIKRQYSYIRWNYILYIIAFIFSGKMGLDVKFIIPF